MKINGDIKTLLRRMVEGPYADNHSAPGKGPISDKVNIGSAAEMEELKGLAMQAVPEELDIDGLKEAIRSGEYQPDMQSLACRMLSDPGTVEQLLAD